MASHLCIIKLVNMMSTIYVWIFISLLNTQTVSKQNKNYKSYSEISTVLKKDISLKEKAFKILKNKCNVCHKRKNPFMIFKLKNIDKRSKKIYNQVFVKKRMPKGTKIKLTTKEYETLLTWITSVKTKNNGN